MGRAIGVVWQGIRDLYDELFPFVGMNLLWFVPSVILFTIAWQILSLIMIGVAGFGQEALTEEAKGGTYTWVFALVAVLIVYAPNPASAGIHYYANRKVNDERVEFPVFWEGLRLYWKRSFVLFLLSYGGVILLLVNIAFYLSRGEQIFGVIGLIFGWILLIWLMMQMYMVPLLMEQESKSITLVLRNSAVLTLANPGFSIVLLIVILLLAGLAAGIPILVALLGGSLVAIIEQHAVITLLERYRSARRE